MAKSIEASINRISTSMGLTYSASRAKSQRELARIQKRAGGGTHGRFDSKKIRTISGIPGDPKHAVTPYEELMFHAKFPPSRRVLVGVPMTGLVRSEWCYARLAQIIPCNWSCSDSATWLPQASPIGYAVAEARNIIAHRAVEQRFEWLLFIDHDVIMPPDAFVQINEYMLKGEYPVVCGLYFAKSHPGSPLMYRGRGNGSYDKWKIGDKVWVDGIPMGLTLINVKVLEQMWLDADWYIAGGNKRVKKIFDTPSGTQIDPEKRSWDTFAGTEDLAWCNRVMAGKYLQKAGFKKVGRQKYPFLIDTGIFCKHITNDGMVYPLIHESLDRLLAERRLKEQLKPQKGRGL